MSDVRGAVRGWIRARLPERKSFKADFVAGIPGAISSVPDGMASGVLAGVSPVHGLYASFAGPLFGGMQTSTKLMVITTTSAAALAAGSAVADIPEEDRSGALILLTLMAGVVMVAAALLRLGRYTRFVSHSVMTGFLTGIAVNIVLGQVPGLAGADASGSVAVAKFFDVVSNPSSIDWRSLVTGVTALLLSVVLARTRLALFGALIALIALIALVVPSAIVIGFGWGTRGPCVRRRHHPHRPAATQPARSGALVTLAGEWGTRGRGDRARAGRRGGRGGTEPGRQPVAG